MKNLIFFYYLYISCKKLLVTYAKKDTVSEKRKAFKETPLRKLRFRRTVSVLYFSTFHFCDGEDTKLLHVLVQCERQKVDCCDVCFCAKLSRPTVDRQTKYRRLPSAKC